MIPLESLVTAHSGRFVTTRWRVLAYCDAKRTPNWVEDNDWLAQNGL